MILSITDAAKKAKVSRSHLYVLQKRGKLSFIENEKGQQAIDLSELARVFPKVMSASLSLKTSSKTEGKTEQDKNGKQINTELFNQKIAYLQEKAFLRQGEVAQVAVAEIAE